MLQDQKELLLCFFQPDTAEQVVYNEIIDMTEPSAPTYMVIIESLSTAQSLFGGAAQRCAEAASSFFSLG